MAWYAIYQTATGKLLEVTSLPGNLLPGTSKIALPHAPDWSTEKWDEATHGLIARPTSKSAIELTVLGPAYGAWKMWADTLAEATRRGLAAQITTALTNKVDQCWAAYVSAITEWRNAQ